MSVTGKVNAQDKTGANIGNADVHALWSLPDGTLQSQIVTTNKSGFANFEISGSSGGVPPFYVPHLTKQLSFVKELYFG